MLIRRGLLLCLIALALVASGPFARGLSTQAASDQIVVDLTRSSGFSNTKTGLTTSKRCQRGATAWFSCGADIGYPPPVPKVFAFATGKAFGDIIGEFSVSPRASKIFRPPRLS